MNICKKYYPNYRYIWSFKNPDKNVVPGSAEKVKRNSAEYYQAYSEASHWVSNARTPLYLNKKRKSNVHSNLARYTIKTFSE